MSAMLALTPVVAMHLARIQMEASPASAAKAILLMLTRKVALISMSAMLVLTTVVPMHLVKTKTEASLASAILDIPAMVPLVHIHVPMEFLTRTSNAMEICSVAKAVSLKVFLAAHFHVIPTAHSTSPAACIVVTVS